MAPLQSTFSIGVCGWVGEGGWRLYSNVVEPMCVLLTMKKLFLVALGCDNRNNNDQIVIIDTYELTYIRTDIQQTE